MTYTEEFIPTAQGQLTNEEPNYPTAFGITFTPLVGGIIIGVLGLAGAAYLMLNQVKPIWDKHQELETNLANKKTELQQKQAQLKSIPEQKAKLEQAKLQNKEVRTLFYSDKQLNTFLLDINRFITARNGKMNAFVPQAQPQGQAANAAIAANPAYADILTANGEIVNDGSLGPALNGKMIRKTVQVDLEGSYDQIQSIMRSLERLQQLLIVKDLKANLDRSDQKIVLDQQGKVVSIGQPTTNIKTSFKLQAVMPLTQDEAAAAAPAPPKK